MPSQEFDSPAGLGTGTWVSGTSPEQGFGCLTSALLRVGWSACGSVCVCMLERLLRRGPPHLSCHAAFFVLDRGIVLLSAAMGVVHYGISSRLYMIPDTHTDTHRHIIFVIGFSPTRSEQYLPAAQSLGQSGNSPFRCGTPSKTPHPPSKKKSR